MKKKSDLRVSYACTSYGKEEIRAVNKVLANPLQIAAGPSVRAFEEKVAKLFGHKHGVMVNSGSSANLLALETLDLPKGSEVITPALTFGTTVAPIVKLGLTPVFVDVEQGTYVVNVDEIEKKITRKTRALMIPALVGNLPDMERLAKLAKKHSLYLIEDSCDTIGTKFAGKPTGAYADVSTSSFYASHIITAAGGGGIACFSDSVAARRALLMANWGRESTLYGAYAKSEELKKRFNTMINGQPYDGKFVFSEIGYNFQVTEIHGAFGLVQLGRLPFHAKRRRENFEELRSFFSQYDKYFILPKEHPKARTNWLAFPLTLTKDAPFSRIDLVKYLEQHDIQTRPIFTGNILRQPAFKHLGKKGETFPVSDYIMQNGVLIGSHHGIGKQHLTKLKRTFKAFIEAAERRD